MYENLWDLTPDTDLLLELPENYSFETALADLLDNSLQAVWTCAQGDRRMISVNVSGDRISVFDIGRGMDSSEENSIDKWGKIGTSLYRSKKFVLMFEQVKYTTILKFLSSWFTCSCLHASHVLLVLVICVGRDCEFLVICVGRDRVFWSCLIAFVTL